MPQKSYFRAVLDAEPAFDGEGQLTAGPSARYNKKTEILII